MGDSMGKEKGRKSNQSLLWGCGYALIVSQWLSNGSLGSSWLPEFSHFGLIFTIGQISLWVSYLIFMLVIGIWQEHRFSPLHQKKWLLFLGIGCIMVGNFFVFATGSGYLDPLVYIGGMLLVGTGNSVLMLGWGEYYCAIGEKKTCITLSLCFIIGSALFLMISAIGQFSLVAAMIVQLAILIFCPIMLIRAWKPMDASTVVVEPLEAKMKSEGEKFPYKSLVPYFLTVLVFGLILGIITGLTSTEEVSSSPFVWAVGMSGMGVILLIGAGSIKDFTLDRLSRILIPLLAIGMLLIPALMHRSFEMVSIMVCAGYVYARVFYMLTYVSMAQTRTIPVLRLVACVISVDTLGVIIGQVICGITLRNVVSSETIYLITALAIALLIVTGSFSLREKNIMSLWGLKQNDSSDALIEKRSMKVALRYNLTLRETDIAARLAKGLTTEIIAQELDVSVATVRTHMRNIYAKIDVHSQPELMRMIAFADDTDR